MSTLLFQNRSRRRESIAAAARLPISACVLFSSYVHNQSKFKTTVAAPGTTGKTLNLLEDSMNKKATLFVALLAVLIPLSLTAQTPPNDGDNTFYLSMLNPRFLGAPDTISCEAGRGVFVVDNPDLDGDGLPEIIVTEYRDGGRVYVFEVVSNNRVEYVWGSPRLTPGRSGGGQTPRIVSAGDFDNNGRMEIVFEIGFAANDTTDLKYRGIYFYEFTGTDNDYGTEPIYKIEYPDIDPNFANVSVGRTENPLIIQDIDGDGKNELIFTPRAFSFDVANAYILEIESGTFAAGDASLKVEYVFTDMARALSGGLDGYVPVGAVVGNVDLDDNLEIVVAGWTSIGTGAGIGFVEVEGPDSYRPGSVVPISSGSIFAVKAGVHIVEANGERAVIIGGRSDVDNNTYIIDNIISDDFVSPGDVKVLFPNSGVAFSITAVGDQDHGAGSDGFDFYYSTGNEIRNIEYNGSGALANATSYTNYGRIGMFNLDEAYDVSDGLFDALYVIPGMDLDRDGNREVVTSYKGACGGTGPPDSLGGEQFIQNTFAIFVFEWGDSTLTPQLTPTTDVKQDPRQWVLITPEDYQLEQNYPNPFNPETTIRFTLPLNKTVSLRIYNTLGQEVRTLVDNRELPEGTHSVKWDGRDNSGVPVASGTYVYKLVFGNFSKTKTMTLLR